MIVLLSFDVGLFQKEKGQHLTKKEIKKIEKLIPELLALGLIKEEGTNELLHKRKHSERI